VSDTAHKRPQRVAQLLHKELSALTVAGLRDPRIGLVTITEVRVTDDLKNAQVFVSVLGNEEARVATLRGLSAAAGFLKREITHRLDLRFAPNLHFSYDDSLARAQRLDELLHAAARGEHDVPAPQGESEMPPIIMERTGQNPQLTPPPPTMAAERKGRSKKSGTKSDNKTRRLTSSRSARPKKRSTRP
jgi:ribosome-binding factor A